MNQSTARPPSALASLFKIVVVLVGAVVLALGLFLVLPLIQAITEGPSGDRIVRQVDTAELEPPPPLEEEEKPPEPEEEEAPPELSEDSQPLDLGAMESLALGPTGGSGWLGGDFGVKLSNVASGGKDVDALFSFADLDQKPRVVYQAAPTIDNAVRKAAPCTVHVLFIVDQNGRVENPIIQHPVDPAADRAALNAVKKWKFEPGKRAGKAVRFRMRVPITFPEGI